MKVQTITVERKAMYDNVTACLYDMLTSKDEPVTACTVLDLLAGFGSTPHLKKAFADGYTGILLGEKMEIVEKMKAKKVPFVLIIVDGDELIAALTNEEVSW